MGIGVPIWGLTGMEGESAECILECMDFYGVEKAFLFAPILDIKPTRWRKLRRYKRRWKIERLFAWLGNFRRLVVRYERRVENFLGFVHLGCIIILLKRLLV